MAYCRHFPTFQAVSQHREAGEWTSFLYEFRLFTANPTYFMKKIHLLCVLALILTACAETTPTQEEGFDFAFRFGYGTNDNELNSFSDTYTKDMVVDDPITVPLILSDEELASIQEKIVTLNVFTDPVVDPNGVNVMMAPCIHYSLEVQMGSTTQSKEWICSDTSTDRADFVKFMFDLIDAQEEVQALPEAQGGYM